METYKIVLICIIISLIMMSVSYGWGFTKGSSSAILWGVKVAKHFINIEFDEEAISYGIFQYKERIGGCYGWEDLENTPFEIKINKTQLNKTEVDI